MLPGSFKVVLGGWQQFFFQNMECNAEGALNAQRSRGGWGVKGGIKQHLIKLKYRRVGGCK